MEEVLYDVFIRFKDSEKDISLLGVNQKPSIDDRFVDVMQDNREILIPYEHSDLKEIVVVRRDMMY